VFSLQILIGRDFRIIDGEKICWEIILNEKMFNGQEDPEIPVYLSEKKVYYVFLFLKVSQCKLKQNETID
jgi:hypothetical protein